MAERVVVRKSRKQKTPPNLVAETFRAWALEKEAEDVAKTRKERYRKDNLFPMIEEAGTEDDKGSLILLFEHPIPVTSVNADGVTKSTTYLGVKKERRPQQVFQEDKARAWLDKNGLLEHCIINVKHTTREWDFSKEKFVVETEEIEFLSQDAVYLINQEENSTLTDKVLDSFFEDKVVWALVPIKA